MKQPQLVLAFLLSTQAMCMNQFEKTVIAFEGEVKGKQWLADLPRLTERLAKKWGLSDLKPLDSATLTYNYILSGFLGNQPVVLKIGPDHHEAAEELTALHLLASPSVPKVLEYEIESGAILMERAVPGTTLDTLFPERDTEATRIICDLIQGLPRIVASELSGFDLHSKWFTVLDEESVVPQEYLIKARTLEKLLIATTSEPLTLCHADLHPKNIVHCGGTTWLAIDPFPAFGERAFEVSHCIWRPYQLLPKMPKNELFSLLKNRIMIASSRLNVNPERVQRWCFVRLVTAWAWGNKSDRDTTEIAQLVKFLNPLTPENLEIFSPLCHREDVP